jgi:hypothetical protein
VGQEDGDALNVFINFWYAALAGTGREIVKA